MIFTNKERVSIGNGEIIHRLLLMDNLHILDRAIPAIRLAHLFPDLKIPGGYPPLVLSVERMLGRRGQALAIE